MPSSIFWSAHAGEPALAGLAPLALWPLAFWHVGLYRRECRLDLAWSLVHIVKGSALAVAFAGLAVGLTAAPLAGWWQLAALLPASVLSVGAFRSAACLLGRAAVRRGRGRERVAVMAWDDHSRRIAHRLEADPLVEFQGFVASEELLVGDPDSFHPVLGSEDELAKVIERHGLQRIVCQDRFGSGARLRRVVDAAGQSGAVVDLVPDPLGFVPRSVEPHQLAGMPVFRVTGGQPTRWQAGLVRAFDVLVGGVALVLLLPLMGLVALAIKLESPGPVFYRQRRVGQGGRVFPVLKFRSMVRDAEQRHEALLAQNECAGGVLFKMRKDPRVTRVGAIIRRGTVDELPQIFQVVRGELSIVGPRPLATRDLEGLDESRHGHWRLQRQQAKPGLAGLWQASGRSELDFEDLVDLDLYQLERWSFTSDLVMLLRTVGAVLTGRGAY